MCTPSYNGFYNDAPAVLVQGSIPVDSSEQPTYENKPYCNGKNKNDCNEGPPKISGSEKNKDRIYYPCRDCDNFLYFFDAKPIWWDNRKKTNRVAAPAQKRAREPEPETSPATQSLKKQKLDDSMLAHEMNRAFHEVLKKLDRNMDRVLQILSGAAENEFR
jgi:hypothetical protein